MCTAGLWGCYLVVEHGLNTAVNQVAVNCRRAHLMSSNCEKENLPTCCAMPLQSIINLQLLLYMCLSEGNMTIIPLNSKFTAS